MSEYMERHSVSKLIGAPPGYVGFGELGTLTDMVKRNPYSIILFDEIEKAHPDIYNILLQLFDDGRLTDSKGSTIDFNNTICIMTSNIGARNITDTKTLGFAKVDSEKEEYNKMKSEVMEEVNKRFSPEFLNRLDDVIVFNKLSKEDVLKITKLMLKNTKDRILARGLKIEFNEELEKYISVIGYDAKRGARPILRAISTKVEDELSEYLLKNEIEKEAKIKIRYIPKKDKIEISKIPLRRKVEKTR